MEAQRHKTPRTLLEAVRYFADEDVAHSFAVSIRWPEGPSCPRCECKEYSYLTTRKLWKCKGCKYQYSLKKGTIFEDSPLGFDKWLPAIWLLVNAKNGISSHELSRALGVHQETAWHMLGRIRLAMELGSFEKFTGEVQADESFIGGRATNMHKDRRRRVFGGNGKAWQGPHAGKTIVMGMLERDGKVQAHVIPSRHREIVQQKIRDAVLPGASVYTDKMNGYQGIDAFNVYEHRVVDHAERYVDGRVHVNGVENFWSLLKRSLKGTYVAVDPAHLSRYLAEQVFRYNEREDVDAGRFVRALGQTEGKRLMYKELTGKD
jgi:transposase-like protein